MSADPLHPKMTIVKMEKTLEKRDFMWSRLDQETDHKNKPILL
jgi:hypothetical protein